MEKIPCSVEILTRNSARTIARCLESVAEFDNVIVLDGGSTDQTREIAEYFGARVLDQQDQQGRDQPITDFSAVRNRGLQAARHEWFLYLDSDEYLSPESVREIRSLVASVLPSAFVWRMPRMYVHGGRVISCSLGYPNTQTRFFHRSHVREFIKAVHERIDAGPEETIATLRHPTYVPLASVGELRKKAKQYLAMEDLRMTGLSRKVIARKIWHTALVLVRNAIHVRKVIVCRGRRLPFIYEWLRFEYHLKLLALLVRRLVTGRR